MPGEGGMLEPDVTITDYILQIFIAGDAFDDSAFFDEQLEFAGPFGVAIAIQIGGEIDAPSWDPIPLYDTFNLITQPAFPTP